VSTPYGQAAVRIYRVAKGSLLQQAPPGSRQKPESFDAVIAVIATRRNDHMISAIAEDDGARTRIEQLRHSLPSEVVSQQEAEDLKKLKTRLLEFFAGVVVPEVPAFGWRQSARFFSLAPVRPPGGGLYDVGVTLEDLSDLQQHPLFVANPAPVWICDGVTNRFVAVNDAAVMTYGFSHEQWLSMTLADLDLTATGAVSGSRIGRWRFKNQQGQPVIADLTVIPMVLRSQLMLVIIATDLIPVLQLESKLRASEERVRQLSALLDASSSLAFTTDPSLRLTSWNTSAERQLAKATAPRELPSLHEIVRPEHLPLLTDTLNALVGDRDTPSAELDLIGGTGDPLPVELSGHVLHHQGQVVGIEWMATNISDRRRLREHLAHEDKLATLGRLAGGLAHDLNNLLTVIAGCAEECESDCSELPVREHLREIKTATDRASELTRRLLALSRKKSLLPRPVDINTVIRDAAPLLRRVLGDQIEPVFQLASAVPAVLSDPLQIEQLLLNLAVNARDAMPTGGRFTIETATVARIQTGPVASPVDQAVRITIRDTGLGMTPEVRAQLFEPFFSTKTSQHGTGLGLWTVANVVHQAGGSIDVESQPRQGTSFHILLPAVAAAP